MAEVLRGSMAAPEYKHVVLGVIFLKYVSDWNGERLRDNRRWQYGVPPAGNANSAWVQHMVQRIGVVLVVRGTALWHLASEKHFRPRCGSCIC
jgi:type I restriction-modification system DNA methylase subunit